MNKKIVLWCTLIGIVSCMSGCGSKNIEESKDYIVRNEINPDRDTIHYYEEINIDEDKNNVIETVDIIEDEDNIAKLSIVSNGDATVDYDCTSNGDIVYNDKTYHNLLNAIYEINLPYSKEEFIEFIITTYTTDKKDIYCDYCDDTNIANNEDEDVNDITLDMELDGNVTYDELVSEYGETAKWRLTVYEYGVHNVGEMYGCSKYVLYKGINDLTVELGE